ncbi:hypothetical protein J1N35_007470 [Gossypium stocksii]|uniref:Uncharacterized protein n=1 Tax=Gossypium stocksii TaxID=47602 RepID=A0A9D3W7L2_9ROSI|nr:hypothetical protein J1N35_007470 [Gossypium stocksii]
MAISFKVGYTRLDSSRNFSSYPDNYQCYHAFDFNFNTGLMLWGISSYTGGSSIYIGHQPVGYFGRHMCYRRINDLLLSIRVVEGTSNIVLEGDNKGADDEGDVGMEEGAMDANKGDELEPDPIRAYELLLHMMNIVLSAEGGLEFLWLSHKTPSYASTDRDASPQIEILVLIAVIYSQYQYTLTYYTVWVSKQKAMKKLHYGWEGSYNYLWQWCQVLDQYILGSVTDLEMHPRHYDDQLVPKKSVFHRFF